MASDKRSGELETIKWMLRVPGPELAGTLGILAIEMIVGVSPAGQSLCFRGLVDGAAAHDVPAIVRSAIALGAIILATMLLNALNINLKARVAATIENRYKHQLLETVLVGDYASVRTLHTGDWMTRVTSDATSVASTVTSLIPEAGGAIARVVSAAAVLFAFDPVLGAFVLVAGVLTMVPSGMMRMRFKQMQRDIQKAARDARVFMHERLESLLVVHSFAREEDTLAEIDGLLEKHRAARLRRAKATSTFGLMRGLMRRGAYALAALWCVRGIYLGTMSFGTLTAILQLVTQLQEPLMSMAGLVPSLYAAIASADRLREVEALAIRHDAFVQEKPEDVGEFDAIGFDGVRFSYEYVEGEAHARLHAAVSANDGVEDELLAVEEGAAPEVTIRDITLRVPRGSNVAFTGPSGCGKSTALKLFMCLYPIQEGMRYYEDASGRHNLEERSRWLFAYVPQGNLLMSGTIREVVTFGEQVDDEGAIWAALRAACAEEFVRELDKGIDTMLGERGAGLSEGQMQRIAIARAIFSDRPVLLLDECTSALDEETEAHLLENLGRMRDKTALIVTHRPAALDVVDTVVHFSEDGLSTTERRREPSLAHTLQ